MICKLSINFIKNGEECEKQSLYEDARACRELCYCLAQCLKSNIHKDTNKTLKTFKIIDDNYETNGLYIILEYNILGDSIIYKYHFSGKDLYVYY